VAVAFAAKALNISCSSNATEDELLVGAAAIPLIGSLGLGAKFDVERRGLLTEEDGATTRLDGLLVVAYANELACLAGMLVLMLARRHCTSLSALQAR
jgi:hypothetical protein